MKKPLKIKLLQLLADIAALDHNNNIEAQVWRLKEDARDVEQALAAKESAAKPKPEPSERGMRFAEWCAQSLINMRTTAADLRKWALCYDALVTLDGHTPEHIAAVWKFARSHEFYRTAVLSPRKLRQRDSAGVKWFDRLTLAMENKPAPKPATVQITKAEVPK